MRYSNKTSPIQKRFQQTFTLFFIWFLEASVMTNLRQPPQTPTLRQEVKPDGRALFQWGVWQWRGIPYKYKICKILIKKWHLLRRLSQIFRQSTNLLCHFQCCSSISLADEFSEPNDSRSISIPVVAFFYPHEKIEV